MFCVYVDLICYNSNITSSNFIQEKATQVVLPHVRHIKIPGPRRHLGLS